MFIWHTSYKVLDAIAIVEDWETQGDVFFI
jgi:hypothetical protein